MDWREFAKKLILANQQITELETDLLKRAILEDGVVDHEEVEFMVQLKREAVTVHPAFDKFLFRVLKRAVLANGKVSDEEALWLRKTLYADNRTAPAEVEFVKELRREAREVGPEFERLYKDCTQLSPGDFVG
jgi:hypothetical protein